MTCMQIDDVESNCDHVHLHVWVCKEGPLMMRLLSNPRPRVVELVVCKHLTDHSGHEKHSRRHTSHASNQGQLTDDRVSKWRAKY